MTKAADVVEMLQNDEKLYAYHKRYGILCIYNNHLYYTNHDYHCNCPVPVARGKFIVGTWDEIQEYQAIERGYL